MKHSTEAPTNCYSMHKPDGILQKYLQSIFPDKSIDTSLCTVLEYNNDQILYSCIISQ